MNRKGLQELLAWVSHRGKFKVAEAGAGRGLGLFAAQNYPKLNSELFFVNSSGIISDVECIGMTVPQFERFLDKVEKGTSNLLIKGTNNYKVVISTTLILAQLFVGAVDPKQRHHAFANYAANVPLHDLPVYYPKHLVELLTLTTLKPKLFGYFALLDKVFETIIKPQFPAIDKKVFVQLFNYVRSRAMNLKPNDEDPTFEPFVICPLIELINHSFDPNSWIDARFDRIEEDSLYLIRNRKAIKEGEELTISYGRWDNQELFLRYGIVDVNNPFDKLQVALNFEIGDTNKVTEAMSYQSELKRRILVTGPHIDWEKVTLYPNRFSKPLIGALRVAFTNRDILHV